MAEVIGTLGSGILINLLSDALLKKIALLRDKGAFQELKDELKRIQVQFDSEDRVTNTVKNAICAYMRYYHVGDHIFEYVFSPLETKDSEDVFLKKCYIKAAEYVEEKQERNFRLTIRVGLKRFCKAYLKRQKTSCICKLL